jgi:hypothetical protein
MDSSVADLVTTTSFISPASLPTRAQAVLIVSFTRSILSEVFVIKIDQESEVLENGSTQKNFFKISVHGLLRQQKVPINNNF